MAALKLAQAGAELHFVNRTIAKAVAVAAELKNTPAQVGYPKGEVDLTLSGHTHGAQVGAFGRSVLEPFFPDKYMWGRYEHAGKQLYTSSGAGHWAAFRLACPSEAALVTLERA